MFPIERSFAVKIDYVRSVSPPAPFVAIAVAHPLRRNAFQSTSAKLDTAADITALPIAQVQALALPQKRLLEVTGFDNRLAAVPTYDAIIEVAPIRVRLEAIAIAEEYALLGRDVLNLLRLLLDGPALTLEILAPAQAPAS
ncbi:MAG: hypothetical protein HY023_03345 [Chloroflexi bacterium]|nr:hypothetical protein [Chloroflexota bacterium]